jgi:D-threo-aldose 1-dehydrogenase
MSTEIAKRAFGRRRLKVSALGFGAAPLGDLYALLDDEAAIAAVTAGIEAGMTLVDTSPLYGHGLSEHRVGTAVRRAGRETVVLSTKVGRWMTPASGTGGRGGYLGGLPFAATLDYSHDGALRSIEQSLLRLGTDRIDIALIHDVDRRNMGADFEAVFEVAVNGAWAALARLREEGVIRAIGIGVNETEACMRFAERCDLDGVLLAGRYSLIEQGALDDVLPLAEARGIGIMLGGVFNSGILATGAIPGAKYDYAEAPPEIMARVAAIEAICRRYGVPLPVAAIQFARAHPAISSVVLGAVTPAEVSRNLDGWATPVPAALWDDLRAVGLLRADAPVPA